jgi:hypothetical protein
MSSVQDLIECKQCGYKEADYLYYCRIAEDTTTCRRCGYHESWTVKRTHEGIPCGWVHEIDEGFGSVFILRQGRAASPVAACGRCKNYRGRAVVA